MLEGNIINSNQVIKNWKKGCWLRHVLGIKPKKLLGDWLKIPGGKKVPEENRKMQKYLDIFAFCSRARR